MAEQLSFELPAKPALGRDDFFVSPANALAVSMIEASQSWPEGKLVLTGPAGSGKSHLVHVWAALSGAKTVGASELLERDVPNLANGPVAVEDVPDIVDDPDAQSALFHLHNLLRAQGFMLLMTGQKPPTLWRLSLPDLQSRIQGTAHVALQEPDDALLAAVLAKLFADRQITPKPDVIPYLLNQIERSFQSAAEVVDRLDRVSLSQGAKLSRKLASGLLGDGKKAD